MEFIKHESSLTYENAFDIMYDSNFNSIDKYETALDLQKVSPRANQAPLTDMSKMKKSLTSQLSCVDIDKLKAGFLATQTARGDI